MVKFLKSMKFAIILLIIIGLLSVVGTLIPQNQSVEYYMQVYDSTMSQVILTLGWDHLYQSLPYGILNVLLAISLILCVITRFKEINRQYKKFPLESPRGTKVTSVATPKDVELFSQMEKVDARYVYGKFGIGFFGSWILHLGILVIIASMVLGFFFTYEERVVALPGDVVDLEKPGYQLAVEDFETELRKDHTVEAYRSTLTLTTPDESFSGVTEVNSPFRGGGLNIYQTSTGYAMDVWAIQGDKRIDDVLLSGQDSIRFGDYDWKMLAFYPEFYLHPERGPMTISPYLIRPTMLYEVRHNDELVDLNILESTHEIKSVGWILGADNPRPYTVLTVRRDPYTPLAAIGAVLLLLGLALNFYTVPRKVEIVPGEDGDYDVYVYAPRQREFIIENLNIRKE